MGRGPALSKKQYPYGYWKGFDGWLTIARSCESFAAELDPSLWTFQGWKILNPTTTTKVSIHCTRCGDDCLVVLNNIHNNKAMACLCSSKHKWNTKSGHALFMKTLAKTMFKPIGDVLTID